jgi:hypothetical protein
MVETQLAVITLLFDFGEILRRKPGHLAFVFIQPIDERRKGRAQIKAATAPVADIKNPEGFLFQMSPVPARINEIKFRHARIRFPASRNQMKKPRRGREKE